jgi:peptidoglycan hydrolase-like protein with peptidoglycan-binding domain
MNPSITRSPVSRTAPSTFSATSEAGARSAPSKPVPPSGLSRGAKGEAVKVLQDRLIDLKLLPATVKQEPGYGTFGPKTEGAVKAFQKSVSLSQVGSFGPKTHEAMVRHFAGEAPARGVPAAGLERGGSGAPVKQLQDRLIDLHYLPGSVRDGAGYGSFGPMTESAVKAFQSDRGLPQVGKFGPATREEMQRALARQPPLNGTPGPAPGGGVFPAPRGFAAI